MKKILIMMALAFVAGAFVSYFLTTEKIKIVETTREVAKVEQQKVYVDRVIVKTTAKDGSIREEIKETDRSVIGKTESTSEHVLDTEITNPRHFSLALTYKNQLTNLTNPSYSNIGLVASYDMGFLKTFILGGVFMDSTVMLGIGVKL